MTKKFKYLLNVSSLGAITLPIISISCNWQNTPNTPQKPSKDNKEEYFSNLQPDSGIDKLPYSLSSNLQINYAIEIIPTYIRDGDTIQDSKGNVYRFAGIDTPETRKKENGLWVPTSGLQYKYGKLATNFTEYYMLNGLLPKNDKYKNRPTKIFAIPQKTKNGKTNMTDSYGRIVAILYYLDENGKYHCLNEKLLKEGLARKAYISLNKKSTYYTSNISYYNLLTNAENYAKNNKLGFWKETNKFDEIFPH